MLLVDLPPLNGPSSRSLSLVSDSSDEDDVDEEDDDGEVVRSMLG